jgi:hypothetical protein
VLLFGLPFIVSGFSGFTAVTDQWQDFGTIKQNSVAFQLPCSKSPFNMITINIFKQVTG